VDYRIRGFTPEDLDAVVLLEERTFGKEAFSRDVFLDLYTGSKDTFLVAVTEQELIGYVSALTDNSVGYISSIAVDGAFRRMGIGEALFSAIQELLITNGVRHLALHVREENSAAIALYHKLGFVVMKRIRHYYGQNEPGLLMQKLLSS
jgi:[ribosomal protein S18]-alanine N-acetyltransferase